MLHTPSAEELRQAFIDYWGEAPDYIEREAAGHAPPNVDLDERVAREANAGDGGHRVLQDEHRDERVVSEPEPVLPITIFKPWQLYKDGDPRKGFKTETTGTSVTTDWAGLVRVLSRSMEGDPTLDADLAKRARGGWAACSLIGGRRLSEAFLESRLLGLDIDHHGDVERVLQAFEPFKKIVHSTYRSTEVEPRCRVVFPLKEICRDPGRIRRAHQNLRAGAVHMGFYQDGDLDHAGADPTRLWFLPMHAPGYQYRFEVTDGALLDVCKLAPDVELDTVGSQARPNQPSSSSGALRWAHGKIHSTPEGERHNQLYKLAAWLGGIKPEVSDEDIFEALCIPADDEGEEREFSRTIRDGIRVGRAGS